MQTGKMLSENAIQSSRPAAMPIAANYDSHSRTYVFNPRLDGNPVLKEVVMKSAKRQAKRAANRAASAEAKLAKAEGRLRKVEAKLEKRRASVEAARSAHQLAVAEVQKLDTGAEPQQTPSDTEAAPAV
jgi:hypothetical protein